MEERINKILDYYDISSSQFADAIGVQRSSVSHVLTGRNKPGFDFIQKIIAAYPDISAEWLITGVGKMLKNEGLSDSTLFVEQERTNKSGSVKAADTKKDDIDDLEAKSHGNNLIESKKSRKIDKIIVIYSDKSFDEYHPQ